MSKKNDQSDLGTPCPNQGLSLRDMASIWDSGKKLTRGAKQQLKYSTSEKEIAEKQSQLSFDSKKSIETKKDVKKIDKNYKKKQAPIKSQPISLNEYIGLPHFESYILSEDLVPKSYFSLDKFRIGDLGKNHIPSLMRVILKNNLSKEHYEVRRGQLKKQKTTRQQFLIDLSYSSGGRSDVRSIHKENGIVLVGQNLAVMKVSFKDWKDMFSQEISDLQKELEKQIEQQGSNKIGEENSEKIQVQNLEGGDVNVNKSNQVFESISMNEQNIVADDLKPVMNESSARIDQQKSLQFVYIHPNQSSQIISSDNEKEKEPTLRGDEKQFGNSWNQLKKERLNKKIKDSFDLRQLFTRFCIPGSDFILWPVLIYEPVLGDEEEAAEVIRDKQYTFSDKDKGQNIFEAISKSSEGLFQTYLPNDLGQTYEKAQSLEEFKTTFLNSVLPQILNPIVTQPPNPSQLNLILYPFGSGKLLVFQSTEQVDHKLLTWDRFPNAFLKFYCFHSIFRETIEEIAQAIDRLNDFGRYQVSECKIEEIRNSIDRLVKCKIENRIFNGITLRYSNIQKKVLVLVFGEHQSTRNELIWLNLEQVFPNYTLPQLNVKNKFLLYFSNLTFPFQRSLTSFIQDIYASFFYKPTNNIIFAKSYYKPPSQYQIHVPSLSILDRCIECFYPIRKLKYYKCCFCEKYCHQECSIKVVNKSIELNFEGFPNLWTCNQCEPCTLCLQPLSNKRIECMKCGNMFHEICGKLKIHENALYRERYLCENCIQCKICEKKLKNQDYNVIKDGNYQCSSCQKAEQANEICHICKKQGDGRWAQCSREFCGKWIHKNCDKYIQSRNNFFSNNNEEVYFCPFCRKVEKRRIILKFIEILTVFDEYQYFNGSDYQDLLDYKYVIENPMCFRKMYERCHEGAYDQNTKESILRDFNLLISNALKYNMPKDQPHYQARILNILGSHAVEKFHDILDCTEQDLIKGGLLTVLQEKRRELHKEIYDRYLEIILNYRSMYSTVEVKKPKQAVSKVEKLSHYHPGDGEHFVFSSRYLLKQVFKSSMLKFKTSKKPPTIANLFEIQKVIEAYKCPIKESFCYYHYWNSNVIFYCAICMQHYCCTTKCYKHHVCTNCGIKGCACDTSECGCPPLKQKQRKYYQKIIHERYYDRRQITENFTLCLRCACQKLTTKICCYCQKAYEFYYDFETCSYCSKVYHKECGDVHASETMSKFFFKKEKQFPNQQLFSNNHRLEKTCYQCSVGRLNKAKMFEKLKADSISKLKKLHKLGKFQPLISTIYQENGIKINLTDILMLILNNYDEFLEYESLFEEYKMNFPSIRLNTKLGQRAQERVQLLVRQQAFNKVHEIKMQVQSKIESLKNNSFGALLFGSEKNWKLANFLEPSHVWKERNQLKFRDFMLKNIFPVNYKQHEYVRKIQLQYILERFQKSRIIQRTERLQEQSPKINVINIITLPISKKSVNVQSSQKILPVWTKPHIQTINQQKFNGSKIQIPFEDKILTPELLIALYDEKFFKTFTQINIESYEAIRKELLSKKLWGDDGRESLLALLGTRELSLKGVFQIVTPLIYQKYQRKTIGFDQTQFNSTKEKPEDPNKIQMPPHQENSNQLTKIPQINIEAQIERAVSGMSAQFHTTSNNLNLSEVPTLEQKLMKIHLNHTNLSKISKYKRLSTLHTVITKFLLRCFEMNKSVYRRGNTCILKAEKGHWRVLKKGRTKGDLYEITLRKQINKWFFSINENNWWIDSIDQIISKLKPFVDIVSFRDLADFLGFTFKLIPIEKATHFTRFLQTNSLQDMSPPNKKKVILQLYDKMDWLRNGSFKNKINQSNKQQMREYVITKHKIFYLEKRKLKKSQTERQTKPISQPPYISFQDIKKDLDDTIQTKKHEPVILTEPGDNVFIGPSPIHKLGLFAKSHFPKHTTMVEYIGEVLSESTADVRESRFHFGCYMFGLNRRNCDKREIIDATFKGNMARYLNHSCDPNCKARIEMVNGQPSIFIYSIRQIGQFEELTYDYQFSVDGEEKLVCTCGSKNCQGRLN